MPRAKMIYVSDTTHRRIKVLAARRNRPMGLVIEELIDREIADIENPWLATDGLSLQEKALEEVWGDSALDVYNDD